MLVNAFTLRYVASRCVIPRCATPLRPAHRLLQFIYLNKRWKMFSPGMTLVYAPIRRASVKLFAIRDIGRNYYGITSSNFWPVTTFPCVPCPSLLRPSLCVACRSHHQPTLTCIVSGHESLVPNPTGAVRQRPYRDQPPEGPRTWRSRVQLVPRVVRTA